MNRENRGSILVVDDEQSARQALVSLLEDEGHDVREAAEGYKALGILKEWEPDILLTDLRMPLMDGIELITKAKEEFPGLVCIVMTAFASVETAVKAMKSGADDYLTKPLNFDAVELVVDRALDRLDMSRELTRLREKESVRSQIKMIGNSAPIQRVIKMVEQVANSRATVLITGESGTGKELVARLIHESGNRSDEPFVALHCAALPESLLESELFGHEKGAFTGAHQQRKGRFEDADSGTLFLDEIGEISQSTQVKLLRFLQTKEFERVGGNETISVDTRIVAATNRNLEELVHEGEFREDLYYRLNVINIHTPPLRSRRSDISLLARHFIDKYARENEKEIDEVAPEVLEVLDAHDWPGNVRELENVVERAVVLADGHRLEPSHLPPELGKLGFTSTPSVGGGVQIPGSTLDDLEKYAILQTYEATGGDTKETAEILGISQRKVQYKLREYRDEDES